MRSAMYRGSPFAMESMKASRALFGDQDGVEWPRRRKGRGVPPVKGMSILLSPGFPLGLNQISDPSPLNPRLRRRFPGVCIERAITSKVIEPPSPDLTHPDVELSSLVGDER